MLAVLMFPITLSCGDDDENGITQVVDGVNVNDGKKLVELSFGAENRAQPEVIKVNYDSKGRMSEFLYKDLVYNNDIKLDKNTDGFSKIFEIDYDLRIVKYILNYNYSRSYGFTMNKDGYICQLGKCSFNYDTNGYLQGIEDPHTFSSFAYNESDIIKASATKFKSGNINLYYVTYDKKENNGDLYVRIEKDGKSDYGLSAYAIGFLIAYQSGLFGKVSKRILNLKSDREKNAFLDYLTGNTKSNIIKFHFVWQ